MTTGQRLLADNTVAPHHTSSLRILAYCLSLLALFTPYRPATALHSWLLLLAHFAPAPTVCFMRAPKTGTGERPVLLAIVSPDDSVPSCRESWPQKPHCCLSVNPHWHPLHAALDLFAASMTLKYPLHFVPRSVYPWPHRPPPLNLPNGSHVCIITTTTNCSIPPAARGPPTGPTPHLVTAQQHRPQSKRLRLP